MLEYRSCVRDTSQAPEQHGTPLPKKFSKILKILLDKSEVMEYNAKAVRNAAIAQQVERILGKDEVASSNLASSSILWPNAFGVGLFSISGMNPIGSAFRNGVFALEEFTHAIIHALEDTAKLLPLLFLTYLLMEYLEHHTGGRLSRTMTAAKKGGPFFGSLLGLIPQCGFAGAASNLYAGGAITMGTLLAVFLATSDEMLPILISTRMPVWQILAILGVKLVCGIVVGFLVDGFVCRQNRQHERDIHDFCRQENCSCEGGIFRSALRHTVKIALVILVAVAVLNVVFEFVPREDVARICNIPVLGEVLMAIIGLMPNCAASVLVTDLYVEGVIGCGPMFAGLLANAGVGLLVLFRVNRKGRENLTIAALLACSAVILGIVLGFAFDGIL